jgi:hypothetical protein
VKESSSATYATLAMAYSTRQHMQLCCLKGNSRQTAHSGSAQLAQHVLHYQAYYGKSTTDPRHSGMCTAEARFPTRHSSRVDQALPLVASDCRAWVHIHTTWQENSRCGHYIHASILLLKQLPLQCGRTGASDTMFSS